MANILAWVIYDIGPFISFHEFYTYTQARARAEKP